MKKLLPIIITVTIIVGLIYIGFTHKPTAVVTPVATNPTPVELCFYYESKANRGLYDVSWTRLNITGSDVTGEFRYLPAEKDRKVGMFSGIVGPVDKVAMARTLDVWWNSMAEGMETKEQLKIIFGEGTAQAEFGEMVDQGDGTYVYKDPNALTLGVPMTDVACSDLDDRIIVEQYIRDNIKTLVPESPVLGGSWYVISVHVDPVSKTGTMTYEDGHIQGSATFSYIRNANVVTLSSIQKS